MSRYTLVLLVTLCATESAWAGSWADAMFEELSKDFGSVPRGPGVSHPFRVINNTGQAVHISNVRVSCGCVSASALKESLAPGESTAIQARMDTRRFVGMKTVSVYVEFDQPQWQEVRLWLQADGRDDININPELFAFGQTRRGTSPSASVNLTFSGNGQAQLVGIQRESNYIQLTAKELTRDADQVTYQVTATIRPDTPVGKWSSEVWLRTNNPSMPRLRVPLTVEIESALSVTPAMAALGEIVPGSVAERKIIVRGAKPFRITKVLGTI